MANSTDKKQMSSNNLVIVMVLVSLIVIGITALGVKFLVTSIILDSHVLKAKLAADSNVKQDVTNAPQLINSYNALGNVTQSLNDALPTSVDYPSLVIEIENMSHDAGVTLTGVTTTENTVTASTGPSGSASSSSSAVSTGPSAAAGTPGTTSTTSGAGTGSSSNAPQQFTFTVTYTGTFDATTKFIAALESSVRPMEVTGVNLTGSGSSLNGSLNLTTWYTTPAGLPFGMETVK